jgi:hypothetical protein
MSSKVPIIGFIIIGLIITLVAVLFPMALYSADYAIDNGTASESTNTSLTISGIESMWFWGVGILVFILTISLIIWSYWK